MAQHLCIVARDKPLLLGYLNLALEHLSANGEELQIVIDRRPDSFQLGDAASAPSTVAPDQRRLHGVDELLRTQGYAIVSRAEGAPWQLSDRGEQYIDELAPVDELEEEEAARVPDRRRTLLSALVVVAAVVGVAVALPRDSMYRLGDGLVGIADRGTSWLRAPVTVSPPASSPALTAKENPAVASPSSPSSSPIVAAPSPPAPPANVAALQSARTSERVAITAPRPAEPPRPAEVTRLAEPTRAPETPKALESSRAAEPQRPPEPMRALEPSRTLASAPAVAPPRPADPPRVNTPGGVNTPGANTPGVAAPGPIAETGAATATRAEPSRRNGARVESALPPKADPVTAPASPAVAYAGVPRFEMSRERDAAGRTAAITVRVTDAVGRPLPSADVRILRQFSDGAVRETQLQATTVGSYRGALPNGGPNTDGLVMRVMLGDRRFEVPLAE
jgi:hypothetical protein